MHVLSVVQFMPKKMSATGLCSVYCLPHSILYHAVHTSNQLTIYSNSATLPAFENLHNLDKLKPAFWKEYLRGYNLKYMVS